MRRSSHSSGKNNQWKFLYLITESFDTDWWSSSSSASVCYIHLKLSFKTPRQLKKKRSFHEKWSMLILWLAAHNQQFRSSRRKKERIQKLKISAENAFISMAQNAIIIFIIIYFTMQLLIWLYFVQSQSNCSLAPHSTSSSGLLSNITVLPHCGQWMWKMILNYALAALILYSICPLTGLPFCYSYLRLAAEETYTRFRGLSSSSDNIIITVHLQRNTCIIRIIIINDINLCLVQLKRDNASEDDEEKEKEKNGEQGKLQLLEQAGRKIELYVGDKMNDNADWIRQSTIFCKFYNRIPLVTIQRLVLQKRWIR